MTQPITQAVIMAAGRGTRLRPLTDSCPKPLLPVAGRPIMEWTVRQLPDYVRDVIVVVGYRGDMIRDYFGDTWNGRRFRYVDQAELNGTADAVRRCQPYLNRHFLVLNGDDLYRSTDIRQLAELPHDEAMLVHWLPQAGRFGTVTVDDAQRIRTLAGRETADQPGWVNIGVYRLSVDFFDYQPVQLTASAEYGLPQTLMSLAADKPVAAVPADFWIPIATPADLAAAEQSLQTANPLA
jgi:NDP-sugar pyrophosphorylase family protein